MIKSAFYRTLLPILSQLFFIIFFSCPTLYGKSAKSWHILLYGDAGFGSHGQQTVGDAMALRHSNAPYDFAVSMGDNQYVDGNQVYYSIFEKPYQSLIDTGVVFYQTIGNHDLENDRLQMQLAYSEKVAALENKTGGFALPAENYLISKTNLTWVVLNVSHPRNNIEIPDATVAFAKKHLCDPKRQKDTDKWMVVSMHYPM
ncbi:MAG: metallophosphoesterase, partial [Oligoflexales bacterium]|nr:metallophosphoesterase [Oligoflexales bacterium]